MFWIVRYLPEQHSTRTHSILDIIKSKRQGTLVRGRRFGDAQFAPELMLLSKNTKGRLSGNTPSFWGAYIASETFILLLTYEIENIYQSIYFPFSWNCYVLLSCSWLWNEINIQFKNKTSPNNFPTNVNVLLNMALSSTTRRWNVPKFAIRTWCDVVFVIEVSWLSAL